MDQPSRDAAGAVALIGDLVSSREHPDRAALQRTLVRVLDQVEDLVPSLQRLDVTVGDEFQGAYATLADAVRAALLVRLALLPDVDTRYGLGAGTFTVFDPDRHPVSQDGPAWWAARAAITTAEELAAQARTRTTRTWYARAQTPSSETPHPALGAAPGAVNAFLACRDDILARMTPRELRLLHGTLLGRQQSELAAQEGIGQPAVSQALARSGAHTVIATLDLLAQDSPEDGPQDGDRPA